MKQIKKTFSVIIILLLTAITMGATPLGSSRLTTPVPTTKQLTEYTSTIATDVDSLQGLSSSINALLGVKDNNVVDPNAPTNPNDEAPTDPLTGAYIGGIDASGTDLSGTNFENPSTDLNGQTDSERIDTALHTIIDNVMWANFNIHSDDAGTSLALIAMHKRLMALSQNYFNTVVNIYCEYSNSEDSDNIAAMNGYVSELTDLDTIDTAMEQWVTDMNTMIKNAK